ncbi:hypothetical protein [Desertivirga arenae]|uniref:hypothetical protein n=1 Tax=Desertivirga arenae TaxID=2810309 RepID=UPI001A96A907|nr:hypothetical protein [Pedobacter sp. SYSU D00823]
MSLLNFTLDELLVDQAFIRWVMNPQEREGGQWLEWSLLHPENAKTLAEAIILIQTLCTDKDQPAQQELDDLWKRIEDTNEEWDKKAS